LAFLQLPSRVEERISFRYPSSDTRGKPVSSQLLFYTKRERRKFNLPKRVFRVWLLEKPTVMYKSLSAKTVHSNP